jgi:hypothetical protein
MFCFPDARDVVGLVLPDAINHILTRRYGGEYRGRRPRESKVSHSYTREE